MALAQIVTSSPKHCVLFWAAMVRRYVFAVSLS